MSCESKTALMASTDLDTTADVIDEATNNDGGGVEDLNQDDTTIHEKAQCDDDSSETTTKNDDDHEASQGDITIHKTPATQNDSSCVEGDGAHDDIKAGDLDMDASKLKESLRSNMRLSKRKTQDVDDSEVTVTADQEPSSDSPDEVQSSDGKYHVRIDNFQRPLHVKALIEWLQALCLCIISPEAIWINSIKTHCYVDFSTYTEAKLCIEKVTGKKFPLTSTYILQADFTLVSAAEAPHSTEAALKPGAWKQSTPVGSKRKIDEVAKDDSEVTSNPKQKIDDKAVDVDEAAASKRPAVNRASTRTGAVGTADIFRRATAGILFGGSKMATDALQSKGHSTMGARASEAALMSSSSAHNHSTVVGDDESHTSGAQRWIVSSSDSRVDDLFKKTAAYPPIYWLPVGDEVVQQRLKSKLMKSRNVVT